MAVLSIISVAHCFMYAWGFIFISKTALNHSTFIYMYTSSTPSNWEVGFYFGIFVRFFVVVVFLTLYRTFFFLFALYWISTWAVVGRSNRVQKATKSTIQCGESRRACLCHPPSYYCAIQVLLKPLPVGMLRTTEELLGAECHWTC